MKSIRNILLVSLLMINLNVKASGSDMVETKYVDIGIQAPNAIEIEEEMEDINSLSWVYKLGERDKSNVIDFFGRIFSCSKLNNAFTVLKGTISPREVGSCNDCLESIQTSTLKTPILTTLGQIRDLARVGNTARIVSLLENIIPEEERDNIYEPHHDTFTPEKKDSLVRYFKSRKPISDDYKRAIYSVKSIVEEESDILKACFVFDKYYREKLDFQENLEDPVNLYPCFLNDLEDLGEGEMSFEIWSSELYHQLGTLNLANKPRILELIGYAEEGLKQE